MKKKIVLVAVAVVVLAAVAAIILSRRGNSGDAIRISGNIEATTVEVSFRIPGRLKERLVDEGNRVTAGQTVATLETDDLSQEAAQRRADAASAQALLDEARHGSRREEIARGEAALARAQAEAARLERDARRAEALLAKDVVSRQQADAARTAATAAQAAAREAQETMELLRQGPRSEQIAAARARLRGAQAGAAAAQVRLGHAVAVSPIAGIVTAKNAEPGETLAAGAPVVTVADLQSVWLRGYITETDLARVKLGQPVAVTADSRPGKKYRGSVTFISPEAEFTPRNVQTEKERVKLVYRVKVTLANPDLELKPGMPADGVIETAPASHLP